MKTVQKHNKLKNEGEKTNLEQFICVWLFLPKNIYFDFKVRTFLITQIPSQ